MPQKEVSEMPGPNSNGAERAELNGQLQKLIVAALLEHVRETFIKVDILERQKVRMSGEASDTPRFRSGKHSIFMYPLAHLSNEIQVVMVRIDGLRRENTAYGLYSDRIGLYNPYTDEGLIERLTDGLLEGELTLSEVVNSILEKQLLMVATGRVKS